MREVKQAIRFYVDNPMAFAADLIGIAALSAMVWAGLLAAAVLG